MPQQQTWMERRLAELQKQGKLPAAAGVVQGQTAQVDPALRGVVRPPSDIDRAMAAACGRGRASGPTWAEREIAAIEQRRPATAPEARRSLGADIAANLIPSAAGVVRDVTAPIHSPVETLQGLWGLSKGLASMLLVPGEQESEQNVKAIGEYLAGRYGSLKAIDRTLRQDPAGLLADVAGLAAGGSGLALKTAGTAGRLGKIAGQVNRVSRAVDPSNLAARAALAGARAAGRGGRAAGRGAAGALGIASRQPSAIYRRAAAAGRAGGDVRRGHVAAIRTGDVGDVAGDVRRGAADIRRQTDDALDAGLEAAQEAPGWSAGTSPGFGAPDPADPLASRIRTVAEAAASSSGSPKQQQRRVSRAVQKAATGVRDPELSGTWARWPPGGSEWHVRTDGHVGRPGDVLDVAVERRGGVVGNIRGAKVIEHVTDENSGELYTIAEPPPRDRTAAAAGRKATDSFMSSLDADWGGARDLSPDELAAMVRRRWREAGELSPDELRAAAADIRDRRARTPAAAAPAPDFWRAQRKAGVSSGELMRLAATDVDMRPITLAIDEATRGRSSGSSAAVAAARRRVGEVVNEFDRGGRASRTLYGADALLSRLDELTAGASSSTPAGRLLAGTRDAARTAVLAQAPTAYRRHLAGIDALGGVEKAAAGKPRTAAEALDRARRADASGYVGRAVPAGVDARLSGAALRDGGWLPAAGAGLGAATGAGLGVLSAPVAIALGAAGSPRLGGVAARTAGDAARLADPLGRGAAWLLDADTMRPAIQRALIAALGGWPAGEAEQQPAPVLPPAAMRQQQLAASLEQQLAVP